MNYIIIFFAFGIFYLALEVFYNAITDKKINEILDKSKYSAMGYTSLWMGIVGGKVGLLIDIFHHVPGINQMPMLFLCLIGAMIITGIELGCGYILNIRLKLNLWNYSKIPGNFLGQINPFHSTLWFLLSPAVYWLDDFIRHYISGGPEQYHVIINYIRLITDFIK